MNIELRDYLAATIDLDTKIHGIELAEQIVGRSNPGSSNGGLDLIMFGYDLEAKLRYMKADAMLAAREARKPEKQADDGWIEWHGGECPVHEDAIVEIKTRYFGKDSGKAGQFRWKDMRNASDIIAYRVVQS